MLTLASMRSLVRTLTAVTATDLLTDALLNQLLNEALYEIYRRQGTGWPFAQTALSGDSSTPPFDAQFHMAVVYRTAAKVLVFIADTTNRAQTYMAEYEALINDMDKFYLSKLVDPTDRATNVLSPYYQLGKMTMSEVIKTVRGLTGAFDKQVLSDGMLDEIINVAATELYNLRDWRISKVDFGVVGYITDPFTPDPTAGWQDETILGPSHVLLYQLELNELESNTARANRPREVTIILPNGVAKRAIHTDSLWNVGTSTEEIFYAFSEGYGDQLYLHIAPQLPPGSKIAIQAYTPKWGRFYEKYDPIEDVVSFTYINFPVQFQMIVPYRAAQFVLMQLAADDPRIEYYAGMHNTLVDALIKFSELDHDNRSFSIGERGKDSPRYVPWFRPA